VFFTNGSILPQPATLATMSTMPRRAYAASLNALDRFEIGYIEPDEVGALPAARIAAAHCSPASSAMSPAARAPPPVPVFPQSPAHSRPPGEYRRLAVQSHFAPEYEKIFVLE
jgi:hypothetical protein